MPLASNIVRRQGSASYYFRVAIPLDLQGVIKRKEKWVSLGTKDPNEARAKGRAVLAEIEATFAELRTRRVPSPDDLQAATWAHYDAELSADSRERSAIPPESERVEIATASAKADALALAETVAIDPRDPITVLNLNADVLAAKSLDGYRREARQAHLAALRDHLARGETALVDHAIRETIERERLLIEPGTPAYRDLGMRLLRAQIEAVERATERDRGDYNGEPRDPLIRPAKPGASPRRAAPGETIAELFERYAIERRGRMTLDTINQSRKIIAIFADFIGPTSHVSAITRRAARDWKRALFEWPMKATDQKVFAGMSFAEIIEANKTHGKPTITEKTINKYLSALAGFANWLRENEYIEEDVTTGLFLELDKSARKVFPYSTDQLNQIFGSPLFKSCQGDGREHKAGNVQIRDWRYWLPLIALFTGARLGEIAQMEPDDVRNLHDIPVFHFTTEGAQAKSLKTAGSARVVPVHPVLISAGLLTYRDKMKQAGHARLFPEIEPDARGFFSGTPSKFLNTYLRKIGAKSDASQNFHSFRHGMADAFRRAGYLDEQFAPLLGHTKATTTGRYGVMPEGPLHDRLAMIRAVEFPGLDLSHLRAD
jgi:integrase